MPDHGVADRIKLMSATSQNGYTANDEDLIQTWTIPGTERKIRLRKGAPGALLVDFAAWFHVHIEPLDTGQLDDWGFAVRPIRGQGVEYDADGNAINLSNHASGTAEDLNATKHPLGQRGTYTTAQYAAIRAKLKDYDGCIRAGLDYTKRADEMHFEIVRSPAACQAVWDRISKTPTTPPKQEANLLSDLTDADAAKIGAAVAKSLQPVLDTTEQKYTVADNNYDSQRAAWEAVGQAYAAHLLAGGPAIPADKLNAARDAVWAYYRPLWGAK